MADIGRLVCGHIVDGGIAKQALDQLGASINYFGNHLAELSRVERVEELKKFAPFCARVVLENSCAALMGRFDTFRMMYLSEFQAQPEYDPGRRAKSSFSWSGDVLPTDDKPNQVLWHIDHDIPKISRALLSRHFDHVYWKPAVNKMLDFTSALPRNHALVELALFDSDTFIDSIRGRAARLHSALSKGVHWEFFNSVLVLDEITIRTNVRDTLNLISVLGLVSHFVPTAYASLPAADAVNVYIETRGEFNDE